MSGSGDEGVVTMETAPSENVARAPNAIPEPILFRNILMATDFSKCSERALQYASGIAHRYSATLHLFHWVDPTPYRMVGEDAVQTAREAAWRDIQQLDTDFLVRGLPRNITDKVVVEDGDLLNVLWRVVADRSIDLIVIGTHGRTGWRKFILGSVAEKIFRHASCPVLTVGPNVTRSRGKDDGPHDILFPTDFSPQSQAAEPYAFSATHRYNGHITLLRVIEHPAEDVLRERNLIQKAREELQLLANERQAPMGKTDMMVKVGPAANVILRVAAQKNSDLIVVGIRAARVLADRLMWPNAYRIVCEAACPVLSVRLYE